MKNRASSLSLLLALLVLVSSTTSRISASRTSNPSSSADYDTSSAASLSPCPSRCTEPITSTDDRGARIAYLLLIHNERTLNDAAHVFRAIRDPCNLVLIHVDRKAQDLMNQTTAELWQEVADCPCGSMVRVESMFDVQWGQWSMTLPTLWAMQVFVREYAEDWDVFINLSGDTLPVYTTDTMAHVLSQLPYNFVTSRSCETGLLPTNVYLFPEYWHKRTHYTKEGTEPDPVFDFYEDDSHHTLTLTAHFGSQWVILQRDFCRWLVQQLERDDSLPSQFRDYLIEKEFLMSDETYLATLLVHVPQFQHTLPAVSDDGRLLWKNGTASGITAVRYERMDEQYPSAFGVFETNQRYDVPANSTVEQTRTWGPYFLGVYDLGDIRDSGALFVRKVTDQIDDNVLRLLPVERPQDIPAIYWPNEIAIIPKPSLQRLKEEMLAKVRAAKEEGDLDEWFGGGKQEDDEEL